MSLSTVKQIVIITDGHSNMGFSPVEAARRAFARGVTVSTIGILDGGNLGENGRREVDAVAAAGGGVVNCINVSDLGRTLYAVTWQATQCTLNMIINQELKKITGVPLIEMPPQKRAGVVDMMTGLVDRLDLQLVLLLDTSASMTGKMSAVLKGVQDLIFSLSERMGETRILVARYPGKTEMLEILAKDADFCWNELRPAGRTPTGPAVMEALKLIDENPALLQPVRPVLDVVI